MLTAQQFYDTIAHGIGTAPDPRLSLWDVLNQAGRKLIAEHSWSWLVSDPTNIAATANQGWIELPDDYDKLIVVRVAGQTFYVVVLQSMYEIEQMRGAPYNWAGRTWYVWPLSNQLPKGSPGGTVPNPRLEVYPIPTADNSPTFTVTYLRKWVEISPSDPSRVLSIPELFTAALIYRARADAKILQSDETQPPELALYADELARLKKHDLEQSINRGIIRGGAERGRKRKIMYGFTEVRFQ